MAGRIGSAGCRTGSCMGRDEGDVAQRVAVHRCVQLQLHSLTAGPAHEDGQAAEGCVEVACISSQPVCLCRQDFRLMSLQDEDSAGVTEFGLRVLMGLLCPVRAAPDMRSAGIRSDVRSD